MTWQTEAIANLESSIQCVRKAEGSDIVRDEIINNLQAIKLLIVYSWPEPMYGIKDESLRNVRSGI